MSDLTPQRRVIQQEEIAFNAAVAEDNLGNIGAATNHLLFYNTMQMVWTINGQFGSLGVRSLIDQPRFVPFDCKIVGAFFYMQIIGGVVSQYDIVKATQPGAGETSIFSTKPQFNASAADLSRVGTVIDEATGSAVNYTATNCVTPVINEAGNVNYLNAGETLILKILNTNYPACDMVGQIFIVPR